MFIAYINEWVQPKMIEIPGEFARRRANRGRKGWSVFGICQFSVRGRLDGNKENEQGRAQT